MDNVTTQTELKIEAKRLRGRSFVVAITLNNENLHTDEISLYKADDRKKFAKAATENRKGIEPTDIIKALDGLAASELAKENGGTVEQVPTDELDIARIVRPELFITEQVVGIAVPKAIMQDGKATGTYMLYLQYADGKRASVPLTETLDLSDGTRFYLDPSPAAPSPSAIPGWSSRARQKFLAGAAAPNPADIFAAICERLAHYLEFPEDRAAGTIAVLALWIMHTYLHPLFLAVPYLYVGGPTGSGKSRLFEVLCRLAFRPFTSSNISAPTMFRTLHDRGGTLILDEAERLKESTPEAVELRSILLAGYKRGGKASRLEPSGDTYRLVEFDVYGPKAVACINGLPGPLMGRCIVVTMFRASQESPMPRRPIDALPLQWQEIRDDLHAMALEYGVDVGTYVDKPNLCPAMSGRNYELWHPIMALAAWVEDAGANGLLSLVQKHAGSVIVDTAEDTVSDTEETILRALAELVLSGARPMPKEVLAKAVEEDAEAFKKWSAKGVATVLKRYGIRTTTLNGFKRYTAVSTEDLRRIERVYGLNLNLPAPTPGACTPTYSQAAQAEEVCV